MNEPISQEPKFVSTVDYTQRIFAGVAFTMFLVTWVSGFDIISNLFKPDFVVVLTIFRIVIILMALTLSGFVGYKQGRNMVRWAVESYKIWQSIMELKKGKDERDKEA